MMENGTIERLKEAALRCDGYCAAYGVVTAWTLHPMGLKMTGRHGVNSFQRLVHWDELDASVSCPLLRAERAVLKGLSD